MSTIDNLKEERLKKLQKIREIGWNPYPASYDKTHTVAQAHESLGKTVKTAGKIMSMRTHGNIAFADLVDETGKIQIFFKKDLLGKENYKNLELLDIGDYLGIEGEVIKTIAGEISVAPVSYTLLSKSVRPLPNQWYGLKDTEARYRQRYLDLLLNPDVRQRFNTRTKVIRYLRQYLDELGFWEVETPVLQPLYGGANARPFKTHFNALSQDMYLRIADELYLKRLIVGGYERVYEISKDFRNEGLDRTHNPEFTMIEWYEAYADYQRVMDVAEGMLKFIAGKLNGNTKIKVEDKEIDINGKWPRIEMSSILKDRLGLDVEKESAEMLADYCRKNNIELIGGETKGQLIFAIFEHKIPETLIEPTWIIDYPEDVSPLSKSHRSKPGWVERFEGYIGGREIFDGWSELTDPAVQRRRFLNDEKASRRDKSEAQQLDEDFITAMEFGMPPTGGIGVGIDRLTMFFTNTWAIKETILFPTLRKIEEAENRTESNQKGSAGESVGKQSESSALSAHSHHLHKNPQHPHFIFPREKALEIVNKNIKNKNLVKHCLAVEAAMKGLARHFAADENRWGVLGLVHDADWEVTQNDYKQHSKVTGKWLLEAGLKDEELLKALYAHNYHYDGEKLPETQMAWALFCSDDLTGLIVASALVTPNKKLAGVTVESVLKKMKSKSFAANVNREQIRLCEEKLGIKLEHFIQIVLTSMQAISAELGL